MPLNGSERSRDVRPVRVGSSRDALEKEMTREQAHRWGDANMPRDLRRAGFETVVFASDREIHGGLWYRVNYGMRVNTSRTARPS